MNLFREDLSPEAQRFPDDGRFPNSDLPVLLYHQIFHSERQPNAEQIIQQLAEHGWSNAWVDGVYPFAHYHSTTHEVLVVTEGAATIQLGGPKKGRDFSIRSGDAIVIPAGVAHQKLTADAAFTVVGAYPGGRDWDILKGEGGERPAADERIAAVPLPEKDPVTGDALPLRVHWNSQESNG